MPEVVKTHRHKVEEWSVGAWGRGKRELLFNGYEVLVLQDEKFRRWFHRM